MSSTFTKKPTPTNVDNVPLDVELRQVFKIFDGETAVCGINLNIHKGEFFSILGPSGCGKTTTLRLIAGFESPSAGDILIQKQNVNDVPAYRRPVNTVFQNYALFNHLTVVENVAFSLKIKKLPKAEIRERVQEALVRVQMEGYTNRFPNQLSGGQQQRVALARALVNQPAVVLLDEPLGALDLKLRKEMQVELSRLHQDLGVTFVMVTHDQEEALSMSDRIAVMSNGKIEQIGTPHEIYERPATPFIADFIGDTNLIEGYVNNTDGTKQNILTSKGLKIVVDLPEHKPNMMVANTHSNYSAKKKRLDIPSGGVVVSVRPEKIKLSLAPPAHPANCYEGHLEHMMFLGTHVLYVVRLESGDMLRVKQPNTSASISPGTPVYVYWSAADCLALNL
ncbi:MAG: ABC transporter ATP-binding protein [Limnothrix sp.]